MMSNDQKPRVGVTGASGFVGDSLCTALEQAGYQVVPVSRSASKQHVANWDPATGVIESEKLNGLAAFVHLAGESIQGRWTEEKKRKIRDSRVEGTKKLVDSLLKLPEPPARMVSCSATGIYGSRGDDLLDEDAAPGDDFLAGVALGWEAACDAAKEMGIPVAHPRLGLVLDPAGGALGKMLPIFKWGLGGKVGDGKQWWSWITRDDVVRGLVFLVEHPECVGPFNFVAPNPVTNAEFTQILASVLHRPSLFPVPKTAARLAMGEMADALLFASARVEPKRLLESGFAFQDMELEPALKRLLKAQ